MFNKITNTICAVITIVAVIPLILEGFSVNIMLIYLILIVLIYTVPFLCKHRGKILNIILYYIGTHKYNVTLRETIYEFLSRTDMRHEKHFILCSRINGLNEYTTRFGWSKEGELNVEPLVQNQIIARKWDNDKMKYLTLLFDRYYKKGESINTGILLDNLKDEEKKSLLYLSTGIFDRTKTVRLIVKLNRDLKPKNIFLNYYKQYFDYFPDGVKPLNYDYENLKIEYTENYPRKNSKYVITWDFDE